MPISFMASGIVPTTAQLAGSQIDLWFSAGQYFGVGAVTDVLSISRASTGYAKTLTGTLTSFGTDTLRITNLGLLIEDARTNTMVPSQSFTLPTEYSGTNVTTANNQTSAPDGTTTAAKITEDSTAGAIHTVANGAGNPATTGAASFSVYLKAAGRNFGFLGMLVSANTIGTGIIVDLTSGAITETHTLVGSPTGVSSTTEVLANGWIRLSVTQNSQATTGTRIIFGPASVGTGNTWTAGGPTYNGDGSSGVYCWGAQSELDSALTSSYIPTTSASVTRAADLIESTGSLLTLVTAAQVSWITDYIMNGVIADGIIIASFLGGYNAMYQISGTSTTSIVTGNETNLGASIGNSKDLITGAKAGLAWNNSGPSRSFVGGGGTVTSDAHAFSSMTKIRFGFNTFGYFRRFTLWNSKLADATLQGFTFP